MEISEHGKAKVADKTPVVSAKPAPVAETLNGTVIVDGKKGYNLFKNQRGLYELQVDNGNGRIGVSVYSKEEDAKEVLKIMGLK